MKNPLISVIIPTYNCERTIGAAIDSMCRQTYQNLEIIVVNDNSTDNTEKIVRNIAKNNTNIKLVQAPDDPLRFDPKTGRNINAGYSARNAGFQHAQGDLITFQDADDVSLLNRIEIQFELLEKFGALHVTTDWIQFDEKFVGKKLDLPSFMHANKNFVMGPKEIFELAQKTKGIIPTISQTLNKKIPFSFKRMRLLHKLFWGSLDSYPGIPGIILFKREILNKVQFRQRDERIWPSFTGRGADRDFNFQVAETFKKSYVFFIPLYMWHVKEQNPRYKKVPLNDYFL